MRLPNAEQAFIDLAKLRDYCLNPAHPRGRHKARVFRAALGFTDADAEALRNALLPALPNADAVLQAEDRYGRRYAVDCPIVGPKDSAVVRTIWIVFAGQTVPRLTTCFVI
jgi:hypothetical protein